MPDHIRTKLDVKGVKCLFLGYYESTKEYQLICLETKKIIKSPDVVLFEDKMHLEDYSSERVDEASAVNVEIFPQIGRKGFRSEQQCFRANQGT